MEVNLAELVGQGRTPWVDDSLRPAGTRWWREGESAYGFGGALSLP
jgi:hypothetical protein